jgi:hydroxyacylglutathione hydrolase
MRITVQPLGQLGANAYLIESDGKNVLIDPGGSPVEWPQPLPAIDYLICTHAHFDHIAGADTFRRYSKAPLLIHAAEAASLMDPDLNASSLTGRPMRIKPADRLLQDGETIQLDATHELLVIATPGHSIGGICLLLCARDLPVALFSGDTLFAGSIGRLDLNGGDPAAMKISLERLLLLPDSTRVCPGHGPETTIGDERNRNPYLQGFAFCSPEDAD